MKHYNLTPRECEVAFYLKRGETNQHIADKLGIGESTVKSHVRGIRKKMKVNTRTKVALILNGISLEVKSQCNYCAVEFKGTGKFCSGSCRNGYYS